MSPSNGPTRHEYKCKRTPCHFPDATCRESQGDVHIRQSSTEIIAWPGAKVEGKELICYVWTAVFVAGGEWVWGDWCLVLGEVDFVVITLCANCDKEINQAITLFCHHKAIIE